MRLVASLAFLVAAAAAAFTPVEPVHAQTPSPQLQRSVASDLSAQRRIRHRATPIYIYGRRPLSPTAVRACVDWYAYEYRPSGTVIVPRMACHWIDR
jgi:hypothetical protein